MTGLNFRTNSEKRNRKQQQSADLGREPESEKKVGGRDFLDKLILEGFDLGRVEYERVGAIMLAEAAIEEAKLSEKYARKSMKMVRRVILKLSDEGLKLDINLAKHNVSVAESHAIIAERYLREAIKHSKIVKKYGKRTGEEIRLATTLAVKCARDAEESAKVAQEWGGRGGNNVI